MESDFRRRDRGEQDRLHLERLAWLEAADGPLVALAGEYPDGHRVPFHHHSRSQLLHPTTGVVMVSAEAGRWMVPPGHAMWIPAGAEHAVDMLGDVDMHSVYIAPGAVPRMPEAFRVVATTALTRSLVIEVATSAVSGRRAELLHALLLEEIPRLPTRPLGLPLPSDARLAALCRGFLETPTPHLTIDEWAARLKLSRRSFTRRFQRETGLGLSAWRQQACLFAALPRLAEGEPVTGVALDLGYESVPAFTTMFRRMLGASPRDWLRSAAGG
jgi:AraC-like DNA-binding protein